MGQINLRRLGFTTVEFVGPQEYRCTLIPFKVIAGPRTAKEGCSETCAKGNILPGH